MDIISIVHREDSENYTGDVLVRNVNGIPKLAWVIGDQEYLLHPGGTLGAKIYDAGEV